MGYPHEQGIVPLHSAVCLIGRYHVTRLPPCLSLLPWAFAPSPSSPPSSPGQMCNHETAGGGADARRELGSSRPPPAARTFVRNHSPLSLKHWLDVCPFFGRLPSRPTKSLSAVGSTPLSNLILSSSQRIIPARFRALCKFHGSEPRSFVSRALIGQKATKHTPGICGFDDRPTDRPTDRLAYLLQVV